MEYPRARVPRPTEPPDGGYGWLVLACCSVCLSTVFGLGRILGLVFVELISIYEVNRKQTFLILIMNRLFGFAFAPLIGKLFYKFDYNFIICTGSVLLSLSIILTGCTSAYWQIVITYGCLQGLGTSFVMAASPLTVGIYFKKRRSLAMGILYGVAGVSAFVCPMFFNWLLEIYGFNGTVLIMGGISLHSCALGMLVRQPIWLPKKKKTVKKKTKPQEPNDEKRLESPATDVTQATGEVSATETQEEVKPLGDMKSIKIKAKPSTLKRAMAGIRKDLRLFQDGHFLLQLFNRACGMLTFVYFLSIVPDFVEVEIENVSKSQVAFILSMSSIGEILVRFFIGTVLDKVPWPKRYSFGGVTTLLGVTALSFQFATTYTALVVGSVFFGLWLGMFTVLQHIVEMELMGPQRIHMANGLTRFVNGITNVIAGILIGYLRDDLGSYKSCLTLVGGASILGGLIWTLEPLVVKFFPLQLQRTTTRQSR